MNIFSQSQTKKSNVLVYVDSKGVLRWKKNKTEAAFFGVNYTTPFAYAYRAHKALNADLEKAIQQDVYHFSRLGFDAFRVHVWDTEISDSSGNLLENEHLRLFDFLLAELKKRNIKTVITPIAFWGNGYPERDQRTPGFSRVYGKGKVTVNDTAIRAQENYLQQFFRHVNQYTRLRYQDDPDVIAVEINNEPSHSGPKASVTNYINRMATALKSTGWTKPVYYNIAQNPYYADAVAKANIDGVSFQWYPSGLVSGGTLKGNYLPHVDKYTIPFDTIPEYRNKSLMVYEFDAADVLQPIMYPAMARSFREAGFQWATQFAYDPMAIAYANTEYQTHYLNLAYTPSKAISMLIASEVFHRIPRKKNYGGYPADSTFDVFRLSYHESLSEMNTEEKFYYSNTTKTNPLNAGRLKNIAGFGKSPVVQYEGAGAYFLDKIEDGIWRLEVMPDAIHIRDPFERASPKKEVTRIQWETQTMQILLPDLGKNFHVKSVNEGNPYLFDKSLMSTDGSFAVRPGTYLVVKNPEKLHLSGNHKLGSIFIKEFAAPQPFNTDPYLQHEPHFEVSAGRAFTIKAKVVGVDTSARLSVQISKAGGRFNQSRTIIMERNNAYEYSAEVPVALLTPGELTYRIIVQKGSDHIVFPGNIKSNPFAWDNYYNENWKTFVAAENSRIEIFNPTIDRDAKTYASSQRNVQIEYITAERPSQLVLKMVNTAPGPGETMGFQYTFNHKIKGRTSELPSMERLMIRARTTNKEPLKVKISLFTRDAASFSTLITLTDQFKDIVVPLNSLTTDSSLLLPRPYPDFMPLYFRPSSWPVGPLKLADTERIEIITDRNIPTHSLETPYNFEVETIWVEKNP